MTERLIRIPGIIDPHVHLRDPGATHKEDFYTGTCAAVAGGVTTVSDMPNNPIPTSTEAALAQKEQIAAQKAVCDYGFYLLASQENCQHQSEVTERTCGLKIYMDVTTGHYITRDLAALTNHFKNWPREKPICVHAEGPMTAAAIGLAEIYQRKVHICHVSQASQVTLIKKAKERGIRVTCEVTPHHLFLTEDDEKSLGPFGKMKPPLGTKADQVMLWLGLKNGLIDMIATDHAPHTKQEKLSDNPPFGVPGLETTLPLLLTAVAENRLTMERLIQLTSANPARIFGLKSQADQSYVLVDLAQEGEIPESGFQSKCDWSPFSGAQVRGIIREVWIRGTKVWDGEQVLVKPGFGQKVIQKI